jgi:hypothetical protein
MVGTVGGKPVNPGGTNSNPSQALDYSTSVQNVFFRGYNFTFNMVHADGSTTKQQTNTYISLAGYTAQTPDQNGKSAFYVTRSWKKNANACQNVLPPIIPQTLPEETSDLKSKCNTIETDCPKAGEAALGLLAFCFILSLFCVVVGIMRLCADSQVIVHAISIMSFLCVIFTTAALSVFAKRCTAAWFSYLDSLGKVTMMFTANFNTQNNYSIKGIWGPGFVCPLTALLLMTVIMAINLVFGPDASPMRASPSSLAPKGSNQV